MKKIIIGAAVIAAILALLPVVIGDIEVRDLDDAARKESGLKFIKLTDGLVHYDLAGPANGEIAVLIHGNAAPYFSWDKNVKSLTDAGFRVLLYDLYGFGYSDRPRIAYTRALYDRQLVELLDQLGISTPVNLVGTSQGGSIAVYFTSQHPERVKRLALLSPFINILPMKALIAIMKMPVIGDYLASVALDRTNINYPKKVFAGEANITEEFTKKYRAQLSFKGFKQARLANFRGDNLSDFTPQYQAVDRTKIPVLLTWGTADQVIMGDSISNIRKAIPGLKFHEIPGGGHLVHYENPEMVNDVLVRFLEK
jgi:pimeloyl-ACP methyl ester carboxylesterase